MSIVFAAVPFGMAGGLMGLLLFDVPLGFMALLGLSSLAGLVSTAELEPGEQVLTNRFVDPATLADAGRPKVPQGQQQVSIDLEAQRALG